MLVVGVCAGSTRSAGLVRGQGIGPAAQLRRVADAGHVALALALDRLAVAAQGVAAEALAGVFDAGNRVAALLAVANAHLDRLGGAVVGQRRRKGAIVAHVWHAANVLPAERLGHVLVVRLVWANGAGAVAARTVVGRIAGAGLHGVAAGQLREWAVHVLCNLGWDLAVVLLVEGEGRKVLAGGSVATTTVAASVDVKRLLQSRHVPAIDKVAVEAVASGVTVGEYKGLVAVIPIVLEGIGVVKHLVEEARHVDGEVAWAVATVVGTIRGTRVGHVRPMVGGV